MEIKFKKEELYYTLNDVLEALEAGDRSTAIYMLESLINRVRNS